MRWILLDALNIIHGCSLFCDLLPDKHLAAGERLLDLSMPLVQGGACQLIVVFDGGAAGPVASVIAVHPLLLVAHTPKNQSADEFIVAAVRRIRRLRNSPSIAVVSDDGAIGAAVRALGCDVLSVALFAKKLRSYGQRQGERLGQLRRLVEKKLPTVGDLID
ncbi:MAG: NYN domain-containing protein [Puniceicoccales bacterium]|jgi:predicted RNA-binding protein with PIN domain|nr:NYN domain-containing protein [Puniceicoccales bacterium]